MDTSGSSPLVQMAEADHLPGKVLIQLGGCCRCSERCAKRVFRGALIGFAFRSDVDSSLIRQVMNALLVDPQVLGPRNWVRPQQHRGTDACVRSVPGRAFG